MKMSRGGLITMSRYKKKNAKVKKCRSDKSRGGADAGWKYDLQ